MSAKPARPSVVRRLLWAIVGSLSVVAIVLGAGGAWLINGIVEGTADRLLGASARAIAETLAVEDGEITLDLPPFALGMLENNARDNVYYSVRHNGRLVTGYPDLPMAAGGIPLDESNFRYETFRGARIRVAAEARRLPRIHGAVVVEVAETLDARRDLASQMLAGLAALEAVLVAVAGMLIWPAVRWSLQPVIRLREEMDARPAARADFTPLPVAGVPLELAGVVGGFNDLLQRLEGAVEGMRRFTADASHQMRTPLAILRTHLALVRKHGPASEAGRASLADIELATDRLQGLLTGLITLARTEDIGDEGASRPIDVRSVVRQVTSDLGPQALAGRIGIHLDAPGEPAWATANPLLMAELLSNLVDNAIRYNRPGGSVAVTVRRDEERVAIEVEDDGPGIPEADQAKVFQRFYRLPRDQRQAGTGLGLSIVRAIAARLDAELVMQTGAGGRGLKVIVSLPASSVQQADVAPDPPPRRHDRRLRSAES